MKRFSVWCIRMCLFATNTKVRNKASSCNRGEIVATLHGSRKSSKLTLANSQIWVESAKRVYTISLQFEYDASKRRISKTNNQTRKFNSKQTLIRWVPCNHRHDTPLKWEGCWEAPLFYFLPCGWWVQQQMNVCGSGIRVPFVLKKYAIGPL